MQRQQTGSARAKGEMLEQTNGRGKKGAPAPMGVISHQICVQGARALQVLGQSSSSCGREELWVSREPLGMRVSGHCFGMLSSTAEAPAWPSSCWGVAQIPPPRCLQQLMGKEPGPSCSSCCRKHPWPCGITPSLLAVREILGARWNLCGVTESPKHSGISYPSPPLLSPALCHHSQPFLRGLGQLQQGNPHWILEV